MQTIRILEQDNITRICLDRANVRNAFNPQLIAELTAAFDALAIGCTVRAAVLEGRGKVFCAGADLNWMREMAGYSPEHNLRDAQALASMLSAIDNSCIPVVARIQRAAFGGAIGLLACCDSVICSDDCLFAFSEVRLGISPATIAPYVIRKIGVSNARDLFLSGEVFDARRALRMGLVQQVVPEAELDETVSAKLGELLKAGPMAAAATKQLIRNLAETHDEEILNETAGLIARLRVSPEGQEGLSAFLEKRPPKWTG